MYSYKKLAHSVYLLIHFYNIITFLLIFVTSLLPKLLVKIKNKSNNKRNI